MTGPSACEPARVRLRVPARPEYLAVVRLAVAGLAYRLGFEDEEVSDLKLAVAEACGQALAAGSRSEPLQVDCLVHPDALEISVGIPPRAPGSNRRTSVPSEMGLFLMKALMDRVDCSDPPVQITLVKNRLPLPLEQ